MCALINHHGSYENYFGHWIEVAFNNIQIIMALSIVTVDSYIRDGMMIKVYFRLVDKVYDKNTIC